MQFSTCVKRLEAYCFQRLSARILLASVVSVRACCVCHQVTICFCSQCFHCKTLRSNPAASATSRTLASIKPLQQVLKPRLPPLVISSGLSLLGALDLVCELSNVPGSVFCSASMEVASEAMQSLECVGLQPTSYGANRVPKQWRLGSVIMYPYVHCSHAFT